MENLKDPEPDRFVIFTDKHGVTRKGMYKTDVLAFVEIAAEEMPVETKLIYKKSDVAHWTYAEDSDPDLTRFVP